MLLLRASRPVLGASRLVLGASRLVLGASRQLSALSSSVLVQSSAIQLGDAVAECVALLNERQQHAPTLVIAQIGHASWYELNEDALAGVPDNWTVIGCTSGGSRTTMIGLWLEEEEERKTVTTMPFVCSHESLPDLNISHDRLAELVASQGYEMSFFTLSHPDFVQQSMGVQERLIRLFPKSPFAGLIAHHSPSRQDCGVFLLRASSECDAERLTKTTLHDSKDENEQQQAGTVGGVGIAFTGVGTRAAFADAARIGLGDLVGLSFFCGEAVAQELFCPRTVSLGKQPPFEQSKTISGAEEVPMALFRLDSVLFPGSCMDFNIFEPRYRLMMKWHLEGGAFPEAEDERLAFGIIAGDSSVGTMVQVEEIVEMKPDGCCHVKLKGLRRFRLLTATADTNGDPDSRLTPHPQSFGLAVARVSLLDDEDSVEVAGTASPEEGKGEAEIGEAMGTEKSGVPPSALVHSCRQQVRLALAKRGGDQQAVWKAIEQQIGAEPIANSCPSEYSFWLANLLSAPNQTKAQWLHASTARERLALQLDYMTRS